MANIKSQIKRIRTNELDRQRNKAVKSSLKTSIRKFQKAADAGSPEAAELARLRAENERLLDVLAAVDGARARAERSGGRAVVG